MEISKWCSNITVTHLHPLKTDIRVQYIQHHSRQSLRLLVYFPSNSPFLKHVFSIFEMIILLPISLRKMQNSNYSSPKNTLLTLHLKSLLLTPHIPNFSAPLYRKKDFSEELSVLIATIFPFLSWIHLNLAFFPTTTPKPLLSQTLLTPTKPKGQSSILFLVGLPAISDIIDHSLLPEKLSSLGF